MSFIYSELNPAHVVAITYTNYRGETAVRQIVPLEVYFGHTVYHPEDQWLLKAFDVEKMAERDFAMLDIHAWVLPPTPIT